MREVRISQRARRVTSVATWLFCLGIAAGGIYWRAGKEAATAIELANAESRAISAEYALAQERLEENEAINQAVDAARESAGHGYAILDERGRVEVWNKAMVNWSGYTEEEMLGRDLLELMPEEKRPLHEHDYAAAIGDRKALERRFEPIPCQLIPKDKSKPPVSVIVNVRVFKTPGGKRLALALVDLDRDEIGKRG